MFHLIFYASFRLAGTEIIVSALDCGSSSLGSSLGWGHCTVFLGKTLTLTVPFSAQLNKWVPAGLMQGGSPAMYQHPINGGVEIQQILLVA